MTGETTISAVRPLFNSTTEKPAASAILHKELDRLQFGPTDHYVLIKQTPFGFGAQISRRMLGLKLALALGRKAVFADVSDPPYVQTLEPQCAGVADVDWSFEESFDPLHPQHAAFLRFEYVAAMERLAGRGDIEEWTTKRVAERYALADAAHVDGEILKWMRWLPSFESEIDAARERLGVSANTLGVHMRRGDKTVEAAYVPATHFNAAIARIYDVWRFDSIFLASDNPRAANEISLPPGVKLLFDQDEKRYNNANHKMLFRSPDLARQETFTAAKNFSLLSACGGLVGQDNAHFATLSSAVIASNFVDPDRIILLHGQIAEIESPMLRRYFDVKRKVRGSIRSRLPDRWRSRLQRFKLF